MRTLGRALSSASPLSPPPPPLPLPAAPARGPAHPPIHTCSRWPTASASSRCSPSATRRGVQRLRDGRHPRRPRACVEPRRPRLRAAHEPRAARTTGRRPPARQIGRVRLRAGDRLPHARGRGGRDLIDPGVRYWDYVDAAVRRRRRRPAASTRATPATRSSAQLGRVRALLLGQLTDAGGSSSTRNAQAATRADLLRQRGERRRGPRSSASRGRPGAAAAAPRPVLVGEHARRPTTTSDTTVVMGQEDTAPASSGSTSAPSSATGNAFDRAGLTNGDNYVIDLDDETVSTDAEFRAKYGKGSGRRSTSAGGRLGPAPAPPERRGGGRGPDPQPDRGRRVGPAQPERLLLRHDRGGAGGVPASRR